MLDEEILSPINQDFVWSAEVTEPEVYGGLLESMQENKDVWIEWGTCENPHETTYPLDWKDRLDEFQKLIVLRAFRPEKMMFAFQNYVIDRMSDFYIKSQNVAIDVVQADTN